MWQYVSLFCFNLVYFQNAAFSPSGHFLVSRCPDAQVVLTLSSDWSFRKDLVYLGILPFGIIVLPRGVFHSQLCPVFSHFSRNPGACQCGGVFRLISEGQR